MEIEDKLVSFEFFESIRKNVAFHFTSRNNMESILTEGLRPSIGDNASGGLGQSAIEKTYMSYGLEGVLQLYNRLITASFQQRIGDFAGITHKPFVPDSAKSKKPEEPLSLIEGFEMIRQYMEDNVYFIFEAPQTQYEHSISAGDLATINDSIKDLKDSDGEKIVEKIKSLNEQIEQLAFSPEKENLAQENDEQGKKEEIIRLINERNRLALLIREKTLPMINEKRGSLQLSGNPIIDEIDYNDERQRWVNQIELPHNAHTRIVENDGKLQGVRITQERLKLFSQDGKKPSNGLDFLETMLSQVNPNDRIYLDVPICHDCNLLFKFLEYVKLVEKYKSNGLLVTKPEETIEIDGKSRTLPERQVMDLTDIGKYPELAKFIEELKEYYKQHKYKRPVEEEISNEKMASYLSKIFNSSELKNAYCQNPKLADQIFEEIGNILAKYYISTGDDSFGRAKEILNAYLNRESNESFFQDFLMPLIEERVVESLPMIPNDLSLEDRVKIQEYVYIRNRKNSFYTHCFPGALSEEISKNGLDISKELFKDEYRILATCFKTPYKTGELNYCELSNGSLSYATTGMPERLRYAIGGVNKKSDSESLHDAYKRSLDENLQREYEQGHIDEETMENMRQAGTRIIDFYAKGKSGIAVFRKNGQIIRQNAIYKPIMIGFSSFIKELKNTSFKDIIDKASKEIEKKPDQIFEIYENMLKTIVQIYPDASEGITEFVNQTLANSMSRVAIRNYTYEGFADGYFIDGGKMLPSEFSTVTFDTPSEVVARSQVQSKTIESSSRPSKKEKSDRSSTVSQHYKQMKEDIKFLDEKFKQIAKTGLRPETIEKVDISSKEHIIVATTIDGKKIAVGNILADETEQGTIYYNFMGNVDTEARNDIASKLEDLGDEEKKKIVEQFRVSNPKYDYDYIEEDALDWYAKEQYEHMPEEERESLKKEILESHGKFIVFERDGKTIISPLEEGTQAQEFQGEVIYSRNSRERCNSFFEFVRDQYTQSVDELGRQVLPEMGDAERQNSLQKAMDSQMNELNQTREGGEQK